MDRSSLLLPNGDLFEEEEGEETLSKENVCQQIYAMEN